MATFTASKGYHFSEDGTEDKTWAHFEKVPGSEPPVYEFETTKTTALRRLRAVIDDPDSGYADIAEVDDASAKAAEKAAADKAAADKAAADKAAADKAAAEKGAGGS